METDRKGLYYFGGDLTDLQWNIYRFPLDYDIISNWKYIKN